MDPRTDTETSHRFPIRPPQAELVYEAIVDVASVRHMGPGPLGERRMVAIAGGTFSGPGLKGKILAGGADRQLWRTDGVRQLDALYEMETEDGALITVHNQVLIHEAPGAPRYAFSQLHITAPLGRYDWLNKLVYVGTLDSLAPERLAVVVRVFKLV